MQFNYERNMCLRYYCARKSVERLAIKFIKDLSQYKRQYNTLKGFVVCDCVLLISE